MIENIKTLYEQIEDKYSLIMELSIKFGIRPGSIRTNWFATFFSVPENHQEEVVTILQKKIREQNKIEINE